MPSIRVRDGYATLNDDPSQPSNQSRARQHSVTDYLSSRQPGTSNDNSANGTSSNSRQRAYTTGSVSPPTDIRPSRSRRPSRVSQHILTKTLPPLPSTTEEVPEDPFLTRKDLSPTHHHTGSDSVSLQGRQTDVVVPSDTCQPGRVDSALSLPHTGTCEGSLDDTRHHHDDIVEHLDVIDPQIATVSTLTNAANAIVMTPLAFYSRKPVVVLPRKRRRPKGKGDPEKGDPLVEDEDLLDQHVEDVLRKRDRFRRVMQGVWSFVKTPLGVITAIYGFLVVFWGTGIVFFLAKFINLHNSITQGYWVELCQQVETGLFTLTSIGLIPFRVVDTYRIVKIWRYKRRIAMHRLKAGVPELYDPDDLPDPVYDANYVHVLTEEEQMDLHYQQHKFMESQTWYRPHGTETHRAFPINIALWICILNDLNSFFQCLLSGCMWGLNRFQRPAWTTATTLPAAFIAGILAGVFIWWGGRKTKRTEEVEERLRTALAMERKPSKRPSPSVAVNGNTNVPPAQPEPSPVPESPEKAPNCKDFADRPRREAQPSAFSIPIADEMTVPPAHTLEIGNQ
ncbi:hypothetical protein CERSUDRAFT_80431 [Gelatoporia subvermispora B]|uniref:Uncharacterized protein n=1 Tax=Ceriporiopsis subvermispora (strain B) TaxID=914234 RepID=M2RQP7_CERS8|nr:hypothetical protein CERSUDRAFT_80431 [Gelatoporia subvermispora B]